MAARPVVQHRRAPCEVEIRHRAPHLVGMMVGLGLGMGVGLGLGLGLGLGSRLGLGLGPGLGLGLGPGLGLGSGSGLTHPNPSPNQRAAHQRSLGGLEAQPSTKRSLLM